MKKKYSLILIFTSVLSFGQNNLPEKLLKDCITKEVSRVANEAYGKESFDTYRFLKVIEKNIQDQNMIKDVSTIEYKTLFQKILKHKKNRHRKLYKRVNKLSDSIGFDYNYFSVRSAILTKCPYEVFFDNEKTNHSFMYQHILLLNKLEAQGYNDIHLLNQLIDNIDEQSFSKIVYRAPIILLVMINLNSKYNRDFIKRKRQLKGKSIFSDQMK